MENLFVHLFGCSLLKTFLAPPKKATFKGHKPSSSFTSSTTVISSFFEGVTENKGKTSTNLLGGSSQDGRKWLGSPPSISHEKAKGEQPYFGDLRSPWLLPTYVRPGMILQVQKTMTYYQLLPVVTFWGFSSWPLKRAGHLPGRWAGFLVGPRAPFWMELWDPFFEWPKKNKWMTNWC